MGSEVLSPQEINELHRAALRRELENPQPALAIGGAMCWAYDLDEAIPVLRRSQIEYELGLARRTDSVEAIRETAIPVLAAVHEKLAHFAGTDLPVFDRLTPWRLQAMAKVVLLDRLGEAPAVRAVQREAAGERPLTICFGHTARLAYEAMAGVKGLPTREVRARARGAAVARDLRLPAEFYSHGDGCGRVHPESQSPHRLFKLYCARCAKLAGNRQRDVERRAWADLEGRSIGKGTHECPCGKRFQSTRTGQFRCPDCRQLHRQRRPS
jgi:hypothetical protein